MSSFVACKDKKNSNHTCRGLIYHTLISYMILERTLAYLKATPYI